MKTFLVHLKAGGTPLKYEAMSYEAIDGKIYFFKDVEKKDKSLFVDESAVSAITEDQPKHSVTSELNLKNPIVIGIGTFIVLEVLGAMFINLRDIGHLVVITISALVFLYFKMKDRFTNLIGSLKDISTRIQFVTTILHLPFLFLWAKADWSNNGGLISWYIFPTFVVSAIMIILSLKKAILPKIIGIIFSSYFIYGLIFFIRGEYNRYYLPWSFVGGDWYALPMWTQFLTLVSFLVLLTLFIRGDIFKGSKYSPKDGSVIRKIMWVFVILMLLYSISVPVHYVLTQSVRSNAAIAKIFYTWWDYTSRVDQMVKDTSQSWPLKAPSFATSRKFWASQGTAASNKNNTWYQGVDDMIPVLWEDHVESSPENTNWKNRFYQSSKGFFIKTGEYNANTGNIWTDMGLDYYLLSPAPDFNDRINEVIRTFNEFKAYEKENDGENWIYYANYSFFYRFSSLNYLDRKE